MKNLMIALTMVLFCASSATAQYTGHQMYNGPLTNKMLDGYMEYLTFMYKDVYGMQFGYYQQVQVRDNIKRYYPYYNAQQRAVVAQAGETVKAYKQIWNRMSSAQKQGFRNQMIASTQRNNTRSNGYYNNNMAYQSQAQNQAQQYYYNLQSQVINQNEVIGLNIAENIGGSGYQWVYEY